MGMKGFGFRGKGRKGIAGRQIKRPSKTGIKSTVKKNTKKTASALPGGFNGSFGFS